MKLTCFHFPILYMKQRTFSFFEHRSRIKLPSLSLLVDTTRRATMLLRKNRKNSNFDPHFLHLFLCLLFANQILAPLPGRERLYCSNTKVFFGFVRRRSYQGANYNGKQDWWLKTLHEEFICPRKNHVKANFFD